METACSGIRQKTGRRPAIARVFLPQSGKIAANYKKPTIRHLDVPKQTGLFGAFPGVLPGLSGRRRRDGVRDGSRSGCGVSGAGKKNVRPCSRTFRCSSLSLSVSWRRGRLFWLKIKYLPPNKIQGRIFCVTEWPSLNFRVAPCFAYGIAKIGNKMNNPNFSGKFFNLFLEAENGWVKNKKRGPGSGDSRGAFYI